MNEITAVAGDRAKQLFSVHGAARGVVAAGRAIYRRASAALRPNQHLAADETGQLDALAICAAVA